MEDVWIRDENGDEILGTVMNISEPFLSGNLLYSDRTPMLVVEYTIQIPTDLEEDE